MVYEFSTKLTDTYLSNTGGSTTFTIFSNVEDKGVKTKLNIVKVYSNKENFLVNTFTNEGQFGTKVAITYKAIKDILWESSEDLRDQALRIWYEYINTEGSTVRDSFTIPFRGEYNYYLKRIEQKDLGSLVNGISTVYLYSYEELNTDITQRFVILPRVETSDSEKVHISVVQEAFTPEVAKVKRLRMSIRVTGNIADVAGITYNSETEKYELPITIIQHRIINNPRNPDIDLEKAKSTTLNVKFNNI